MIAGLLVLLACELLGELVSAGLDLPVPGPVVGLVVLLVWLQLRAPAQDSSLVRACEALLRHLQLLFVPAGVGVVQYGGLLAAAALPLLLGLVVPWLLALGVTALVATTLLARPRYAASHQEGS